MGRSKKITAQELIDKWKMPGTSKEYPDRKWWQKIELEPGIFTPGNQDTQAKLERIHLPADLIDKKVIDIGCNDGFFSFECEKRGADVFGIDVFTDSAQDVKKFIGSKVDIQTMNMWELEDNIDEYKESFDLVLFLGMLYHRFDMIKSLELLYKIAAPGALVIIETHIACQKAPFPAARFYPKSEVTKDKCKWWGPNETCVKEMLRVVGFKNIKTINSWGDRLTVHARKTK